jgi:hypothetical protein
MRKSLQPWLKDARKESLFILAPSIVPVILIFLFQDYFEQGEVSTLWWVVLVLCIDVSHVYSTLFRFYWDPKLFDTHRKTLVIIPVAAFVCGFVFHLIDPMLFWRILAYVAVFHFIRQQYGFMRIYSRKEKSEKLSRYIDTAAIYSATLYPVLYWHLHLTDSLSWFVKGDFIPITNPGIDILLSTIYILMMSAYVIKEIISSFRQKQINIPKNLIVAGTYASWYVGIIAFQGDLIFTLLNVVSHGIPYMALVWLYGEKKPAPRFSFNWKGVLIFVAVLLMLAYVEEGVWDLVVWNDHPEVFPSMFGTALVESPVILSIVVALLVLPQITHYVIDGFIWKLSKETAPKNELRGS